MKQSFRKIRKLLLIIVVALFAIYILVSIAGIIETTHKNSRKGVIARNADVMEMDNPRIFLRESTLFCENGRVLEGFIKEQYAPRFSENYDHTMGALVVEQDGKYMTYYIDGDLEPILVCDNSSTCAYMCKDGGYILYSTAYGDALYIYDVSKKESKLISGNGVSSNNYAISSNGKFVAFYDRMSRETRLMEVETGEYETVGSGTFNPLAISRDGKRSFYIKYDDSTYLFYVFIDGHLEAITAGEFYNEIVNDDCTEAFLYSYGETWYYNTSMEAPVKILDDSAYRFHFKEASVGRNGKYSDVYYVNAKSLKNCFFETSDGAFYFHDEKTRLYKFENNMYNVFYNLDGEKIYYLDEDKGVLRMKGTDGLEVYDEPIPEITEKVEAYAANSDLSIIWYTDNKGNLFKYADGEITTLFMDEMLRISALYYSEPEKKVYFKGSDNILYSVSEDSDSIRMEYDGCRYLYMYDYYDYDSFVYFESTEDISLIKIFGNLISLGK